MLKGREIAPLILLCLAASLTIVFASIAENVLQGDLTDFDHAVFLALRHSANPSEPLGPHWLQVAARDVTSLGSPAVLTLVTAVSLGVLALKRQWGAALFILASVCSGSALGFSLKALLQRTRPDLAAEALAETQTYSFPSGHAFLSAVTYLTLGALLAKMEPQPAVKVYILAVAIAIALMVGVSRVYLGVHWPTDVLAGWCAGAAWAVLCLLIAERMRAMPLPPWTAGPA